MRESSLNLISSFSEKEYKKFLRSALGLKLFSNDSIYPGTILRSSLRKQGKNVEQSVNKSDSKPFAYAYRDDELVLSFYYADQDKTNYSFRDQNETIYDVRTYFESLGESNILLMALGAKEKRDYSVLLKQGDIELNDLELLNRRGKIPLSFILGSGIDSGFPMDGWSVLIDKIRDIICNEQKCTSDELEDFENTLGNTTYILPQILKDIDKDKYFNTIYKGLYDFFSENSISQKAYPELSKYTIYQIAAIIDAQASLCENQRILTFNYDNLLEQVIEENFGRKCSSIYNGCGRTKGKDKIEVIHSHGYLPYPNGNKQEEFKDSIVLSSFEYMDTYTDQNTFAYKQLYDQLHLVNLLIGNSVADYEEQKVLRNHHKTFLSEYSFLLLKKSKYKWMDIYKSVYYLDIGLIPIYFDDFDMLNAYLTQAASKIIK